MSAPMKSSKSVINSKQAAGIVKDIHTDVVCTNFGDKLFIVVTQYQKLGTLVLVTKDAALQPGSMSTFSTSVLLGKDEPEIHVMSRSLAAQIKSDKPLLFAIALKNTTVENMKGAEKLVLENKVW